MIGNIRLKLESAKEVVHHLEIAKDSRVLTPHEETLWQLMKLKTQGLSSLQRTVAMLLWLWEGDRSMRFFHAHGDSRYRKNHVRTLVHKGGY
jgi:hypothetical protein